MNDTTTPGRRTKCVYILGWKRVWLCANTRQTGLPEGRIGARIANSLRIINRIHTQLKLRLIWFPACGANEDVDVLRFDDE
jgi:hypothetical protein